MTTEALTQIVETIKTLNLNVDSQSAIEIVENISPMLWAMTIRPYIEMALFAIVPIILAVLILRYVRWYFKHFEDYNRYNKNA